MRSDPAYPLQSIRIWLCNRYETVTAAPLDKLSESGEAPEEIDVAERLDSRRMGAVPSGVATRAI
jgi:hypothetical protein